MYKFKSHLMSMLAIAGMAFMTSCGDDTDPEPENKPVLTMAGGTGFTSTDQTVQGGTNFKTGITATQGESGTNLEQFKVTVSYDNSPAEQVVFDTTDLTGSTFNYTFYGAARSIAGTEKWTFTIVDNKNRSTSKSFTLTTVDPNQGDPINTFEAILMGAQNNATYGSFLDAHTGQVYKRLQANTTSNQALIDIIYFHGATNLATLVAPDDNTIFGTGSGQINIGPHGWAAANRMQTRFVKLPNGSQATYDAANSNSQIQAAYAGVGASKANELEEGDVVAFKTQDGKYGLALVDDLAVGTSGSIKLKIKMQK